MIYTIGHSTHSFERFVALLEGAGIDAVADVRSSPFSRIVPHFNRPELKLALHAHGIAYRFLGKLLGARPHDGNCWDGDRVCYDKLAKTAPFRQGLDRVLEGSSRHRIALMCAEKDLLDCHRTILVARPLQARGAPVRHVHADGRIESHAAAEDRLKQRYAMADGDLFLSPAERLQQAYRRREEEIAHRRPDPRQERADRWSGALRVRHL